MRLLALAALLAAGLSGPAAAAIDLGPIAYGAENKILYRVERALLGDFTDEFVFSVTDLPRPTGALRVSLRADDLSSFERPFVRMMIDIRSTSLFLTGGALTNISIDATAPITFSFSGKVVDLPAAYQLRLYVTPAPAGALLLATGLAAVAALQRRRRRGATRGRS